MLFNITITRTNTIKKFFKDDVKTFNRNFLISAENELHVQEYAMRLPKEGETACFGVFKERALLWKEKWAWKKVDGNDNDAHVLLLKSPTGVLYTKQIKYA